VTQSGLVSHWPVRLFAIAELDPAATADAVRFVKGTLNDFRGGIVRTPVAGANPFFRRSGGEQTSPS
jgi:hypothetical protein